MRSPSSSVSASASASASASFTTMDGNSEKSGTSVPFPIKFTVLDQSKYFFSMPQLGHVLELIRNYKLTGTAAASPAPQLSSSQLAAAASSSSSSSATPSVPLSMVTSRELNTLKRELQMEQKKAKERAAFFRIEMAKIDSWLSGGVVTSTAGGGGGSRGATQPHQLQQSAAHSPMVTLGPSNVVPTLAVPPLGMQYRRKSNSSSTTAATTSGLPSLNAPGSTTLGASSSFAGSASGNIYGATATSIPSTNILKRKRMAVVDDEEDEEEDERSSSKRFGPAASMGKSIAAASGDKIPTNSTTAITPTSQHPLTIKVSLSPDSSSNADAISTTMTPTKIRDRDLFSVTAASPSSRPGSSRRRKKRGEDDDEMLLGDTMADELADDKFGGSSSRHSSATPQQQFWKYVDSYFQPLTVEFMKSLEFEMLADIDPAFQIPLLGRHYTDIWAEEDALDEAVENALYSDNQISLSLPDSAPKLNRYQRFFSGNNDVSENNTTAKATDGSTPPTSSKTALPVDIDVASDAFEDPALSQRLLAAMLEPISTSSDLKKRQQAQQPSPNHKPPNFPTTPTLILNKKPGTLGDFTPIKFEPQSAPNASQDVDMTDVRSSVPTDATTAATTASLNGRSHPERRQPSTTDYEVPEMLTLEQRLVRELIALGVLYEDPQLSDSSIEDDEICSQLRYLQNRLREQVFINNDIKQRVREIVANQAPEEEERRRLDESSKEVEKIFKQLVGNKKKSHKKRTIKQKESNAQYQNILKEKAHRVLEKHEQLSKLYRGDPSRSGNGPSVNRPPMNASGESVSGSSTSTSSSLRKGLRSRPGVTSGFGDQQNEIAVQLTHIQEFVDILHRKYPLGTKISSRVLMNQIDDRINTLQSITRVGFDVQREFAQDLIRQLEGFMRAEPADQQQPPTTKQQSEQPVSQQDQSQTQLPPPPSSQDGFFGMMGADYFTASQSAPNMFDALNF